MAESQIYTAADIVNAAMEQKPVDVKSAFDNLMVDKIAAVIAGKREEVAATAFGGVAPEVEVEVDEPTVEAEAGDDE